MNTKTKTVGLLVGTLFVGMVLGAFLHSLFIRQTVNRMSHKWRKPDFFIERFEEMLNPTAEQKEEIDKILKRHHENMMKLRGQMPILLKSLQNDLNAVLNEDQRKILDEHFKQMMQSNKHRESRRHSDEERENLKRHEDDAPPPPSQPI
jgi:proline dehydrogenase